MADNSTTIAAFACGALTAAFIYFSAMQMTHGWCMTREFTALAIISSGLGALGMFSRIVRFRLTNLGVENGD